MRLIIRFLFVLLGILVAKAALDTVMRLFTRRAGPRIQARDASRVEHGNINSSPAPFSKADIVDVPYSEVEEKRP
jgi:hypothetical protein